MKRFALSLCLLMASCSWQARPSAQMAEESLLIALGDYAAGNTVAAVEGAFYAGSYFLRSLQSTPRAANTAAISSVLATAGASNLAPAVSQAITAQVSQGIAPDAANENVAKTLDAQAIRLTQ